MKKESHDYVMVYTHNCSEPVMIPKAPRPVQTGGKLWKYLVVISALYQRATRFAKLLP